MRSSLRLGTFAGINVGMHWSIVLIGFLLGTSLAGSVLPAAAPGYSDLSYAIAALATTGLFLASIVAHELGHSIVAVNNGVGVKGITLFALGGVAELEGEPKTPGVAAKIALAGPAASIAVGLAAFALAWAGGAIGLSGLFVGGLSWVGIINIALAVFNMIPALPLDGGRVLQSAIWKRSGNRHRATVSAATVGRYLGWALVGLGFWQLSAGGSGLWTIFIGMFVVSNAGREQRYARSQMQPQAPRWPMTQTPGPQRDDIIDVDVIEVDGRPVEHTEP